MSTKIAPAVLLLLLTASASGGAWAQRGDGQAEDPVAGSAGAEPPRSLPAVDRRHERREEHQALSDAVRRVERRTGGQVLSAERVPFDGRNVNRVKVVDESGRIRVYMDDPRSARGAPSRTRDDDE
ncbi:MAG: hypothetical protein M3Q40_09190 [Pseudomonadota bacterium]|nr:hypothetical protein [Pseudomonadota bacterium]